MDRWIPGQYTVRAALGSAWKAQVIIVFWGAARIRLYILGFCFRQAVSQLARLRYTGSMTQVKGMSHKLVGEPNDTALLVCRAKLTALIHSPKRRLFCCGPTLCTSVDP